MRTVRRVQGLTAHETGHAEPQLQVWPCPSHATARLGRRGYKGVSAAKRGRSATGVGDGGGAQYAGNRRHELRKRACECACARAHRGAGRTPVVAGHRRPAPMRVPRAGRCVVLYPVRNSFLCETWGTGVTERSSCETAGTLEVLVSDRSGIERKEAFRKSEGQRREMDETVVPSDATAVCLEAGGADGIMSMLTGDALTPRRWVRAPLRGSKPTVVAQVCFPASSMKASLLYAVHNAHGVRWEQVPWSWYHSLSAELRAKATTKLSAKLVENLSLLLRQVGFSHPWS